MTNTIGNLATLIAGKAYAAVSPAERFSKANTLKDLDYTGTLDLVLKIIIGIASALAILALLIGAAQYLGAMGDPAKAEGAKKTIMWAVTGMVLMMVFYVILTFVLDNVIPR